MNVDYTYCLAQDNCIHRRGCKRWIGNYTNEEVKELYTLSRFILEIDESECIPDYNDVECTNYFKFLDRFRFSDGTEFKSNRWNCSDKACAGYCETCINSVSAIRERKYKRNKVNENDTTS